MSNEFYWVAVAVVTVVASARLTRLAVYDKFPPTAWIREKYLDATDGSNWQLLGLCGFCASFWVTLFVVLTGWLAGVYDPSNEAWIADEIWWAFTGTLSASYLAATYIANDGDVSDPLVIRVEDEEGED